VVLFLKRAILIIAIVGAVGWAIYDFTIDTDSADEENSVETDLNVDGNEASTGEDNQKAEGSSAEVGLEIGNQAPDFELETLEGDTIQLSSLKGERVMVNFWATWCPPCRAEIPDLQKFHEDEDINILAVNLTDTESSYDNVPKFVDNYGMEFPVLMDEESEVATEYKIQPIPTSFMIDSEGIIQYKAMGAMNYDLMVREFEAME